MTTGDTREERTLPGKGTPPTPGNHEAGSVALETLQGQQNGIFPASCSPPCSRTVPWSRYLFSAAKVFQLDGAGSFLAKQGLDLPVRTSPCFRFVALAPSAMQL